MVLASRALVRFLVSDAAVPYRVSDDALDTLLATWPNPYLAAAAVADVLAVVVGGSDGISSEQVGEVRVTYDTSYYTRLASQLRELAARSGTPLPYAGGLSLADKASNSQQPDLVQPSFRRQQFRVS